jgi:hypothetical protein
MQTGLSPLPEHWQYQVVGGTGTFANVKASGDLRIYVDADSQPGSNGLTQGSFTIQF